MSKKEKNSIKDITEDDEETNLFRAEMMNFYKNKTEEELLNEKYRLEIKMYENIYYDNSVMKYKFSQYSLFYIILADLFARIDSNDNSNF